MEYIIYHSLNILTMYGRVGCWYQCEKLCDLCIFCRGSILRCFFSGVRTRMMQCFFLTIDIVVDGWSPAGGQGTAIEPFFLFVIFARSIITDAQMVDMVGISESKNASTRYGKSQVSKVGRSGRDLPHEQDENPLSSFVFHIIF